MDTSDSQSDCVPEQKEVLDTLTQPSLSLSDQNCKKPKEDKPVCSCTVIRDRVTGDPEKIWAILHYPDALKISHKMLCLLLKKLKEYQDDRVTLMAK